MYLIHWILHFNESFSFQIIFKKEALVKVQLNLVMTQDKIKRACIFDNHMQVRAELVWADKKNTSLFLSLLCHQIFCLNF